MNATTLTAVACALIAGLLSFGTVVYQVRQHRKERAEDEDPELRRIETEAYLRARQSYEAALNAAHDEARRARIEATRIEERMEAIEQRAIRAERRADEAERRSRKLELEVQVLRDELHQRRIPLPDGLHD